MDMAKASSIPTTQLELSISCRNLPNKDTFSKSDPRCTLFMKQLSEKEYREIGKTETIKDDLNPHFVRKFVLNYNFETVQRLKFELWDIDTGDSSDFLGRHETTIAQIVAFQGREYVGQLTDSNGRNTGTLVVTTEEVANCKRGVYITLKGYDILGTNFFTKRQTFLTFWRSIEDGSYTLVHKTEVYRASHKPQWNMIRISARVLCNGDFDRNIRIDCMKYKMYGTHSLIGSYNTTLNDLTQRFKEPANRKLLLSNPKDRTKKCGYLELADLEIGDEVSFFDCIKGGTQLHFAVAIDFTASNGDPRTPESLHYIGSTKPNPYELTLKAIGEILKPYNSQNIYPCFGFGAKLSPHALVSHHFPLNGNVDHPYCQGIEEIITHYRSNVSRVTFYGPTNFSPVIKSTAAIAQKYDSGTSYFVLLVITDGIICDMPQTKQAIIDASHLPLSIIIVGVGNDDFAAMDELDSDDRLLELNGKKAARDIVQFVPLRNYINPDGIWLQTFDGLARDVLYEVPEQLMSYMRAKGIKPKNTTAP